MAERWRSGAMGWLMAVRAGAGCVRFHLTGQLYKALHSHGHKHNILTPGYLESPRPIGVILGVIHLLASPA